MLWLLLACQTGSDKTIDSNSVVDDTTNTTDTTDTGIEDTGVTVVVEECINDADFFEQRVWGEALSPVCYSCHNAQGAASSTDLVLISNVQPTYLDKNREKLTYVASLSIEGTSLILRKPLGMDGHGGGAVLTEDSVAYQSLVGFVERLSAPVESCPGDDTPMESNLLLATPKQSLRKISLGLLGTLPSSEHVHRVEEGGELALAQVVEEIIAGTSAGYTDNTKNLLAERLIQIWNDQLLTDKYMAGQLAIQSVDYSLYPSLYWFDSTGSSLSDFRNKVNDSIAREPIELMRHVFVQDLPWSEIIAADYTMVNSWSAKSYGVNDSRFVDPSLDDPNSDIFYPVQLPNVEQVGVLSTVAFLKRYPTTATNRNRHRARIVYKYFLNTDILALADRPIDPNSSAIHNPTLNDPQCNVCHSVMEPVSGAFQNWDVNGHYNPPEDGWYPEMFAPGFDGDSIDLSQSDTALRWLADKIAVDARFARSSVNMMFTGITGLPVLKQYEWGRDSVEYAAWQRQEEFLRTTTDQFVASNLDMKVVIKSIVLSSYFRSVDHVDAEQSELYFAGTARLLTPEELHNKIKTTTGLTWNDYLLNRYKLLYGGIDSDGVVARLTSPNGVMSAVSVRMANDVSCRTTAADFVLPASQRRLFPFVESSYRPFSDDGFAIPEAQERIKRNIQYLFQRILGQELDLNDPEVLAMYDLWVDVQQTGYGLITAGTESTYLQHNCRGRTDLATGLDLPNELRVNTDPYYTIRAWRAVMEVLLADYQFITE